MTDPVLPWTLVFETLEGDFFGLPFGTIEIPQAGTLRMENPDGHLYEKFGVAVKVGYKLTYNERPVVDNGYLNGWPPFPRAGQQYVTVTLLESGFEMSVIDGTTLTQTTENYPNAPPFKE